MSRYLVALSLATVIAGALPAARFAHSAEALENPPSQAVRIDGSELQSGAGIAHVYGRLAQAADYVCRSFDSKEPERQARYRQCVAEALERAIADVHDARLSAYYQAKTGTLRTVAIVAGSPAAGR
jgi:UrcA family protein